MKLTSPLCEIQQAGVPKSAAKSVPPIVFTVALMRLYIS